MSTIELETAKKFVQGTWPEDWKIFDQVWVYENAWGGTSLKLVALGGTLQESPYVGSPEKLWSVGDSPGNLVTNLETWRKARYLK